MIVDSGGGPPVTAEAMVARQVALVNQQSAQIQSSARNLAASAGKGFHIEPTAAATLIAACQDALNELGPLQNTTQRLGQVPQLGQTPGAKLVAPLTHSAATDQQGITQAIVNLRSTLQDMIQAYTKASTNYNETEALVADAMKKEKAKLASTASPPPLLSS